MNNKFARHFIIIIVVIAMMLSSCTSNLSHETIGDTLQYLASDELEGRIAGSKGNLKTQEFIIDSLVENNIEGYNGTYKNSFGYQNVDPIDTTVELNGKKFKENKDYTVRNYNRCFGKYPIATKDKIKDKCILLLDEGDKAYEYYDNNNVQAIMIHSTIPVAMTMTLRNKLVLSINSDTYEYLLKNVGEEINIESKFNVVHKRENNIIGVISGKDAKQAIVISAHFDHIGKANDHIFNGALDNASGTVAVLDIARMLSKKIEKEKSPIDIYFAFFNAEELGLYGSRSFSDEIQKKYGRDNVLNINIDCVGDKDSNTLSIYQNQKSFSQSIADMLVEDLKDTDINILTPNESTGMSDHRWFNNHIFIYDIMEYIHTTEDTAKKIDTDIIKELCNSICDVIIKYLENPVVG